MQRLLLPPDSDETALEGCADPRHRVVLAPAENLTVTYLDTHDWRLHRSGFVLAEERGAGRRLVVLPPDRDPYSITIRSTPRMAADLPPGYLADLVAPLMGIRALLPVGVVRTVRREGRIENPDGDIASLLRIESVEVLDRAGNPVGAASKLLSLSEPGCLTQSFETAPVHDLAAASAARDRRPGDYSSKLVIPLDEDQPAGTSTILILGTLLDTLEANVDGTMTDLDTEFLHDLRVACRRTRSALTQLKGILPPDLVAPFNTEFKWLGSVTGPLRDLDVFQLEMPNYRRMLPGEVTGDLVPLETLIAAERRKAHRSVVRALKSRRFRELLTSWRRALDSIESTADDAGIPTRRLADKRIGKAYRRILKKGRDLGTDPPAKALHRLRIDAKKLRYLLEFFRDLYPKGEVAARIKELKRLQDFLGGFNDMVVQRDRLAGFAGTLHGDPSVPTSSLLAMGRVDGILEDRQEEFRLAIHKALAVFSGDDVRAAYDLLFGGKEPK